MLRFITRLMTYAICLQLAVGCNSSMLAINGDGNFFSISGLIVKSFHKASEAIFPSAVAANVTGEVVALTVDDNYQMVEIATFKLYDNQKSFSFKVDKRKVNQRILKFKYRKISDVEEDRREKFETLEGDETEIYTELDAKGTFAADAIQKEIEEVVSSAPGVKYEEVKDIVRNWDERDFEGVIKEVGSYDEYVKKFKNDELAVLAREGIYASKGLKDTDSILAELKPALAAAQFADKLGGKLKCISSSQVEVVDTSGKGKFEGYLYFDTVDKTTMGVLGSDTMDVADISTASEGNKILLEAGKKLTEIATMKRFQLIGSYRLVDKSNGIETLCRVSFGAPTAGPGVSVDLSILKSVDISAYISSDEAIAVIMGAYKKTLMKLEEQFKVAGINIYDKAEGSKAYETEVTKAKRVVNDLETAAKNYKY